MELEVFDEKDIGKSSFLWEAIYAFANFDKDYVVIKEVFNLVLINEILGGDPLCQPHVFILIHTGVEVKVLDVNA